MAVCVRGVLFCTEICMYIHQAMAEERTTMLLNIHELRISLDNEKPKGKQGVSGRKQVG
jgi:hypothetical protein